jgi:hypothetical protein
MLASQTLWNTGHHLSGSFAQGTYFTSCAFFFFYFSFVFLSASLRVHYIEYLVGLIARHKVDPISIFDLTDVQQELRRRGMVLPAKGAITTDDEYRTLCAKVCQFYIYDLAKTCCYSTLLFPMASVVK